MVGETNRERQNTPCLKFSTFLSTDVTTNTSVEGTFGLAIHTSKKELYFLFA
jgi:hypothetical protein